MMTLIHASKFLHVSKTLSATLLLIIVANAILVAQESDDSQRARRVNVSVSVTSGVAPSHESARSDKFTGGIKRAAFTPGDPAIRITVDVPAFRLTLWQNEQVVSTYAIGIGLADFPVPVGERRITEIIYNPPWIPPASGWVENSKKVKPGEIIDAEDPRNPLGKMKIPLGNGYLIHEAASVKDLGNLVSHGCVRMLRRDIYDLADKIILARKLPIDPKQIAHAKGTKKTLTVKLDEPLAIDLNYDTQVVENGSLHIYTDVYDRGTNTVRRLRQELESNDIDPDAVDKRSYELLLARPTKTAAFVTPIASVRRNRSLTDGKLKPLVAPRAQTKSVAASSHASRRRASR